MLCDSEEVLTPVIVYSDQVLSDVDVPAESVPRDKRQVIRMRDSSPVDASQVGRACDCQRPIVSVATGKRMPGKGFHGYLPSFAHVGYD